MKKIGRSNCISWWVMKPTILEGFGGYYDLVECLKNIARDWVTDVKKDLHNFENIISKIDDIKTIKSAVSFLHAFDRIRKQEAH